MCIRYITDMFKSQSYKTAYYKEKDRLDAIAGKNQARKEFGLDTEEIQ